MTKAQYQAVFAWFRARPAAKAALKVVSSGAVAVVYAVYLGLLGRLAWQRQPLFWGVLCVPAVAFLAGTALRAVIDHPRPYEALDFAPLFPKNTRGKSLPSRHSFCAAAIAVAAGVVNVPLGAGMAVLAAVIAATRVLCGVHWPADVLTGLAFGAAVGFAGFAAFYALIG